MGAPAKCLLNVEVRGRRPAAVANHEGTKESQGSFVPSWLRTSPFSEKSVSLGKQAVAYSWLRRDVPGVLRVLFQLLP